MRPEYIIIHHSQTKDGQKAEWEAIRQYHKTQKGWSDVGYHYGIEEIKDSILVQYGRPLSTPGAHCKDGEMNQKSIGICCVGNFDIEPPSDEVLKELFHLVVDLMLLYQIPPEKVLGHREAQEMAGVKKEARKTCPGEKFDMNSFRTLLKEVFDA